MPAIRLLATKFQTPVVRPNLVARPELVEKLERGAASGSRLTLISAPAGYGKTTLAAVWLSSASRYTWITLEPEDNDPPRFFTALVVALQKIDPDLGAGALSLLELAPAPSVDALIAELLEDIAAYPEPITLVLDDYHHIRSLEVHHAVEFLLDHQPANLHLVLTTREDPPFPLGRLRARGQLTEVRIQDLRFQHPEVNQFMEQVIGLELDAPSLERLVEVTEGWAAGLQLAGLALQGSEDPEALLDSFSGGHQYVIEYLVEEVLRRQPPEIQTFLRRTAVLERFTAELCDEIIGKDEGGRTLAPTAWAQCGVKDEDQWRANSEPSTVDRSLFTVHVPSSVILQALERQNLFLLPLDATRTWFRYHRLFADVLRLGLDPADEQQVHRRAARWFDHNAMPGHALSHYLAAGEIQPAARLVSEAARNLLKNGEMHTLLSWLQMLPPGQVIADPDLALPKAVALLLTGDIRQGAAWIGEIEKQSDQLAGPAQGRLLAVRSYVSLMAVGGKGVSRDAQAALDLLPPEDAFFRIIALLVRGTGDLWDRSLRSSTDAYRQALTLADEIGQPFAALGALANLAYNLVELGDLQEAQAILEQALHRFVDRRGRPLPVLGIVYAPLSSIYLEQMRLEDAERIAKLGVELSQKQYSREMIGVHIDDVLAEIAFARGDIDKTFELVRQTRQMAQERKIAYLDYKMDLLEAAYHLMLGNTQSAQPFLEKLDALIEDRMPAAKQVLKILSARLNILEGHPDIALERLREVDAGALAEGNFIQRISVLIMQVQAYRALNDEPSAVETLGEVIRMAAPQGYRKNLWRNRAFLLPLLPKVRHLAPAFVDELAAAGPAPTPAAALTTAPTVPQPLPEPLSEQERKVLRLMLAGRSNQEIAEELFIGVGTAKWHVHNILGKLGVSSRAQAAARARELGLE